MKVKIVRVKKFVNPGFKFNKKLLRKLGKAMVGSIIYNVVTQKTAKGRALKANPPGYRAMKREMGYTHEGNVLSLVAKKHRFVKPHFWKITVTGKNVEVKPRVGIFTEMVQNVQERGYRGWFGVGKKGTMAIKKILKDYIKEQLKKAQK